MAYDNNYSQQNGHSSPTADRDGRNNESIFSKRIKAGKRRTYFFDVRTTRGNDYFITITESKKRFEDGGYDRHKMFLYKEDFNKFLAGLTETINHVKTDLMPNFDFDAFNHDNDEEYTPSPVMTEPPVVKLETPVTVEDNNESVIDDWKM